MVQDLKESLQNAQDDLVESERLRQRAENEASRFQKLLGRLQEDMNASERRQSEQENELDRLRGDIARLRKLEDELLRLKKRTAEEMAGLMEDSVKRISRNYLE